MLSKQHRQYMCAYVMCNLIVMVLGCELLSLHHIAKLQLVIDVWLRVHSMTMHSWKAHT